jgi:hypothetical protein
MPRLNFDEVEGFIAWLKTRDLTKYDFYRTTRNEVIATPIRSTQPLMYATVEPFNEKSNRLLTDFLAKQHKFIFEISSFEWDSSKMPGVEKSYLDKD